VTSRGAAGEGGLFAIAVLAAACGGAPRMPAAAPPVPLAPSVSAPPRPPPLDPFALGGVLREENLVPPAYTRLRAALGPPPKGLAQPPAACVAFAARKKSGKRVCDLAGLAVALDDADAGARDARLLDLEGCAELPAGLVRALRAELAPLQCGDVLAGPLVGRGDALPEVQHALMGLAIAARLARTGEGAPRLSPPYEKERVLAFIKGPLSQWMGEQARLTEQLSAQAAHLAGYGMGIAAVEAGMADLRLVDAMRAVPVPDTIAKDAELKATYDAALDQVLEPRKDRGRDAALVGLRQLAAIGVLGDERVSRARALLGRLYAGRRIDALDPLLVPTPRAVTEVTPDASHALLGRLPTFYAGVLVEPRAMTDAGGLSSLVGRGLPFAARARLRAEPIDDATRVLVAHARLAMARTYWRAVDVDEAASVVRSAGGDGASPDARMLLALAIALRGGPEDAAQMMRRPPLGGLGIGDVAALDAVSRAGGPHAGIAAFDAAWIKRVSAPRDASATYWRGVAARFRDAEGRLAGPERARALEGAREADAIAAEAR
jgi:hypothetical protein